MCWPSASVSCASSSPQVNARRRARRVTQIPTGLGRQILARPFRISLRILSRRCALTGCRSLRRSRELPGPGRRPGASSRHRLTTGLQKVQRRIDRPFGPFEKAAPADKAKVRQAAGINRRAVPKAGRSAMCEVSLNRSRRQRKL